MRSGMYLSELWQQRAAAFRKEIMPYIRYMGQSGFPAFLSLLFIMSAIGYFSLIRDLPPDFPIAAVGVAALTPVLCWSPLRTWLMPADVVYLMPQEAGMGSYLKLSRRYSVLVSLLPAAAALLLYLPIYRQGTGFADGWVILLAAALVKAGNAAAGWRERQLAWPGMRWLCRSVRWALSGLVVAAWLTRPEWQAALFALLCAALALAMYRLPLRHVFPWERLIEEEAATRRRYYRFFSMFIDVPSMPAAIRRRSYLGWLLPRIRFGRRSAFVYLFAATLIRTELSGILIRMLLLGCFVVYWSGDEGAWAGWGAVLAFAFFGAIFGVQLGGLRQAHRHSVWKHVYPLPESKQLDQLLVVDRLALAAGLLALAVPLAATLLMQGLFVPLLPAVGAALLYVVFIRPKRMKRKLLKEAEDD